MLAYPDTPDQGYFLLGGKAFVFGDHSTQGGRELPGGVAILAMFSAQYNLRQSELGFGLVYQHETPRESQINRGFGVKFEYNPAPYIFELMSGVTSQIYHERAIERLDGQMHSAAFGVRIFVDDPLNFLQKIKSKYYFEGSMQARISIFSSLNGSDIKDDIYQLQIYPFLGMGVQY